MFNKITFNSADTSTWPQFIINGGYNSSVDKPNLTTHAKYGAGLTWVGVDGRDISIYGGYAGPIYQNDLGEDVTGSFVTAEDKTKFWAEDQMSNFTFVNSKGNTSTVTLNWGEALADGGSLPAEENNEEEENNDPAELEDGEKPNEGPIGEPVGEAPKEGEESKEETKEEPKEGDNDPTNLRLKEIQSILLPHGYSVKQGDQGEPVWTVPTEEPESVPSSSMEGSLMVSPNDLMNEFNKLVSALELAKEEPKEEPKEGDKIEHITTNGSYSAEVAQLVNGEQNAKSEGETIRTEIDVEDGVNILNIYRVLPESAFMGDREKMLAIGDDVDPMMELPSTMGMRLSDMVTMLPMSEPVAQLMGSIRGTQKGEAVDFGSLMMVTDSKKATSSSLQFRSTNGVKSLLSAERVDVTAEATPMDTVFSEEGEWKDIPSKFIDNVLEFSFNEMTGELSVEKEELAVASAGESWAALEVIRTFKITFTPKVEFEAPTNVADVAKLLKSFNAEIITYTEALNEIESDLIESKEYLKETQKLDEQFTIRKSNVDTKVAAINTKQAEEIAKVEVELDEEVVRAEELKTAMEVKVVEVETRRTKIQEDPIMTKLVENVSSSLRTRGNDLSNSMSKVNELMARNVKVEKSDEISNAKVEKEVIIRKEVIDREEAGMVKLEPITVIGGMAPTVGDYILDGGTIKTDTGAVEPGDLTEGKK